MKNSFIFTFTEITRVIFFFKRSSTCLTGYIICIILKQTSLTYIYIECVCSPSFTPIHISKYRRPEKASWRINNVIKCIPYIVIWESILYNICITNKYFTLDLFKILIFLMWCTFEKGQNFLRDCIHYKCKFLRSNWYFIFIKTSLCINKTPSLFKSCLTTIILFSNQ